MQAIITMDYRWFRCKTGTEYRFRDYDETKFSLLDHYDLADYGKVTFTTTDLSGVDYKALAKLWQMYNRGSGNEVGFNGPSMSVSDVIELDGKKVYYTQGVGWERIDE